MHRKPLAVQIGFAYGSLLAGQQRPLYLLQACSCACGQPLGIQPMGCVGGSHNHAEGNAAGAESTPSAQTDLF